MSAAFTEKPVSPRLLSHREKMLLLDTIRTSDDLLFVRRSCPTDAKAALRTGDFANPLFLGTKIAGTNSYGRGLFRIGCSEFANLSFST